MTRSNRALGTMDFNDVLWKILMMASAEGSLMRWGSKINAYYGRRFWLSRIRVLAMGVHMRIDFFSWSWVLLAVFFSFIISTGFAANYDLSTPEAQALCARELVNAVDADYVVNVAKYRAETDKDAPGLEAARAAFLRLLPAPQTTAMRAIASIGEGFGRDVRFFREQGLRAIGTDGSAAMVDEASRYLGSSSDFYTLIAQDFSLGAIGLNESQKLSGIWAMASLHHVPVHELRQVFEQMRDALVPGGVIHASFVMGVGTVGRAEVAIQRFWNRIDAPTLIALVQSIDGLEIINEGGEVTNDFFANVPSATFHFYNLWLRRR